MRSMVRFTCVTLCLLVLSAAARAETTQCTAMTSLPYTITTPGIYCLNSSLSVIGSGIAIEASDVTVDLNGHALDVTGIGIGSSGRSNVTVRNGTIRGGSYGVSLGGIGTSGNLVERMRVEASMESGIVVQGHGAEVRNNVLIGVGHSTSGVKFGIHASSGAGIRVSDNELVDTAVRGPLQVDPIDPAGAPTRDDDARPPPIQVVDAAIAVVDAPGAVIERNVVSNKAMTSTELYPVGIRIYPSAGSTGPTTTTVVGNRIANMVTGIDSSGASSLYLKNTVSGATTPFTGGIMAGSTNVSF